MNTIWDGSQSSQKPPRKYDTDNFTPDPQGERYP